MGIMSLLLSLVGFVPPSPDSTMALLLLTPPSPRRLSAVCTHSLSWTNITTKSSERVRERGRKEGRKDCVTLLSLSSILRRPFSLLSSPHFPFGHV